MALAVRGVLAVARDQDLELGRPMEIDAIVSSVQELARLAGVATPLIDSVLALVKSRARLSGCYAD